MVSDGMCYSTVIYYFCIQPLSPNVHVELLIFHNSPIASEVCFLCCRYCAISTQEKYEWEDYNAPEQHVWLFKLHEITQQQCYISDATGNSSTQMQVVSTFSVVPLYL